MQMYLVLVACIVLAYQMQPAEAGGFNFVLPGKWGNSKRSFSFVLPGQWGNSKRAESMGECGKPDPEIMLGIYQVIQGEALRMMDCVAGNGRQAAEKH